MVTALENFATAAGPMVPHRYRVVDRHEELADTVTLALEPAGSDPACFEPGQFAMLWVFGVGEVPISMSGDPTSGGPILHTIRAVGGVTRALCGMEPGRQLGWRGPFGHGWGLADAAGHDVLLMAGGIGLAPIRPALYQVLAHRERYGRVVLLVGARSPADLLFSEELAHWRSRFDLEVEVTVDAGPRDWRGDVGVVTMLIGRGHFDPSDVRAFVCGPEMMMRFTASSLQDHGVDAARIQVSLERNMRCAIAQCGHCQLGGVFVCREGPVLSWQEAAPLLKVRER